MFKTEDVQKNAWREEISILKKQLSALSDGGIIFEFMIPRMGHRIDVVLIVKGIVFLLEFKIGDREYRKATEDQVKAQVTIGPVIENGFIAARRRS